MIAVLDKDAFRHFTPKEMHDHRHAFDEYLARLASIDQFTRSMLENPFAVFSVEKFFPVIHVTALFRSGKWNYFHAPQHLLYKRKDGHQFVNFGKGSDGIGGLQPVLRFEVVSDTGLAKILDPASAEKIWVENGEVVLSPELEFADLAKAMQKPAVLFSAPLAMM
jgi:hypothetical protein